MSIVLLTGDLMGASRVEGAARLTGVPCRMVGSVDAAVAACAEMPVKLVAVDLGTAGIDVADLVQRLKGRTENVPAIVAYGPHVQATALEAATEAGCDAVVSRGQFMSQADAIVARYAGTAG